MRILIADDHELFREALRYVLVQHQPSYALVEAATMEGAIDATARHPDIGLVLLDLSMPGMGWREGIPLLRAALPPSVPVVILSASDSDEDRTQSLTLGADAFVSKASSAAAMLRDIQALIGDAAEAQADASARLADTVGGGGPPTLTRRQRDVMRLLGQGRSNRDIAVALNLAEGTVKLHVTAVLKALNAANRTQAAMMIAAHGDQIVYPKASAD